MLLIQSDKREPSTHFSYLNVSGGTRSRPLPPPPLGNHPFKWISYGRICFTSLQIMNLKKRFLLHSALVEKVTFSTSTLYRDSPHPYRTTLQQYCVTRHFDELRRTQLCYAAPTELRHTLLNFYMMQPLSYATSIELCITLQTLLR